MGRQSAGSFLQVKEVLDSSPILNHFHEDAPTKVHADASGHGLGAVLIQHIAGKETVISYTSCLPSPAEENYSVTEKECCMVIWAVAIFRPHSYGCQFSAIMDHSALCLMARIFYPMVPHSCWLPPTNFTRTSSELATVMSSEDILGSTKCTVVCGTVSIVQGCTRQWTNVPALVRLAR